MSAIGLFLVAAGLAKLWLVARHADGEDVDLSRARASTHEMTPDDSTGLAVMAILIGALLAIAGIVGHLRRRRLRMTGEMLVIERRTGRGHVVVREAPWSEVKRLEIYYGRRGPGWPGPKQVEVIIRRQLPERFALEEPEAAVAMAEVLIEAAREPAARPAEDVSER